MARSEARIFTSIWRDGDFLKLGRGPQLMYLFLLSQPDLSFAGVIPLRTTRWARAASGLTAKMVTDDIQVLCDTTPPFVIIDKGSQELLIRSLIRRDRVLRSPKLAKPVQKDLDMVESPRLRSLLAEEIRRCLDAPDGDPDGVGTNRRAVELMLKSLDATYEQVNTLSDTVSGTPLRTVDGVVDRVSDRVSDGVGDTVRGRGRGELTPAVIEPARAREELTAADVVAAFVDGARSVGQPDPAQTLIGRVARDAKDLIGKGHDPAVLIKSAYEMGRSEYNDLAVQVRKDAGMNGRGAREATGTVRARQALEAGRRLAERKAGRQ